MVSSSMESNRCWCFWKYSGMPTSVLWQIFEFIFSPVKKWLLKGMAQNSGKSHLCNVKYGKLFDGEQQVLVFLKVLRYANKCIVTDFRIHLFSVKKWLLKGMAQNSGKSHLCNVKYGKLYDGERCWCFWKYSGMPTNIVTEFRIHLFSGQ